MGCGVVGVAGDVVLKRGDPIPAEPATGPIYVSTRNDDLQAIIDGCPPDRRAAVDATQKE